MEELLFALRRLGKRTGATAVSVLTLACSIGAAAAIWSLLSAVLLSPLPVHEPERLVVVGARPSTGRDAGTLRTGFNYPYYAHLRDSGIFERVAAEWTPPLALLVGAESLPVGTRVAFVTHEYFAVLGVSVPLGRSFAARDDRRGARPVALLTERYWRQTFDASPDVIGRTITVAGTSTTIVGVTPRGFRGLSLAQAPDLYLPFHTIGDVGSPLTNYFAAADHPSSPTSGVSVIGRIPPGVPTAQLAARLEALPYTIGNPAPRRAGSAPPTFGMVDVNTHAIPAAARPGMVQFTRLLAITVGLLLLIGCGTVGMLLLVRTEARRDEFAICLALGASRARLAGGIAIEGALLSAAGAVLALPVAWWLFTGLQAFQLPGGVDVSLLELSMDMRPVAASAAAGIVATLLITLVAGVFGVSARPGDALRSRAGSTPPLGRRRTRAALVAGQVAIAMVLLAGAGLFARSLVAALNLNPAFATARIITTDINLTPYEYDAPRAGAFFDDLVGRLRSNPALASIALSDWQGGMSAIGVLVIDGVPRQFPSLVGFTAVDDRYFETVGLSLIAGRGFTDEDRNTSPRVTIVSESFGRMMSMGGSPIGQRVTMPHNRIGQPPDVMEVVGVMPDIITNVAIAEPLAMYFPLSQHPGGTSRTVTLRAGAEVDAARREAMTALRQIDPVVAPGPMLTMDERIGRQMSAQRFGAVILGALGGIAVLLTVLGAYVLAESMAVLRRREMGIRAALGARQVQLAGIVFAQTGRLVGTGLLAGVTMAWLGASTIRAFLFKVEPLDPVTIGAVGALILAVSLIVSIRPALRAARVDLGRVLKEE